MSVFFRSLLMGTALFVVSSIPAYSQQFAQEVVEEFFSDARQFGLDVSTSNMTTTGAVVEWKDVLFSLPNGKGIMTWDFVRAEEVEIGKVQLSYPDVTTLKYLGDDKIPAFSGAISTRAYSHIISGPSDARQHDFNAESIEYKFGTENTELSWVLEMKDVSGSEIHSGNDVRHFKGNSVASQMTVNSVTAEKEIKIDSNAVYNGIVTSYSFDTFSLVSLGDFLNGQRNISLVSTIDSVAQTMNINQPEFVGVLETSGSQSQASVSFKDGLAKIEGSGEDVSYNLNFTELPLPPFQADIDTLGLLFQAPFKKVNESSQARYKFDMTGIKASDTLWGMFDPTGSLPRDKANLKIDLAANMKWLVDLIDLGDVSDVPFEMQDVTIQDITLEIAGAQLHGDGFLKLDNTTMPPVPIGDIDVALKGGLGLLDKLVALGFVPTEQGQMVKMFSGMFAVPGGDGDDHLTSKIEMKEGGSILVNGQRVK